MSVAAIPARPTRGLRVRLVSILLVMAATGLFIAQVATGTPAAFALLVWTFILFGIGAVSVLGGPFTLAGAAVTVLMFQHVIVAMIAKAVFLQNATDRLLVPYYTIGAYNVAMLGIFTAACLYRGLKVDRVKPLFENETHVKRLSLMAAIFTIASIVRFFLLQRFGVYEQAGGGVYIGGFVGPLRQFAFISPLAVALGTAAVILGTNGRRCLGLWNGIAIVGPLLFGILGAGRQDAVSGMVVFVFTLIAFRFKLRAWHYIWILIFAYVFQFIVFPYALYARGEGEVRIGALEDRVRKASTLLLDVAMNPGKYKEKESVIPPGMPWQEQRMYYFGVKNPTLERLSVINAADNIINATLVKGPQGGSTAVSGIYMILPRFLNPEKEAFSTSNQIAHFGSGLVGDTDFYTQITFGMVAESFMCFLWAGAYLLPLLASLLFFLVYRLLFRASLFGNVWVAALVFSVAWNYSETPLAPIMLLVVQTPIFYITAIYPVLLFARWMTRRTKEASFAYETATMSDHPAT